MEKGHTETENDSVHATIEIKTRRIELYTPTQRYAAVRTARVCKDPYKVIELTDDDIINFKNMSERVVKYLLIDGNGDQVLWSKVRQVSTCEDEPQVIVVKTEFDKPGQTVPVFRRTRRSAEDGNENIALDRGIPQPGISQAKKEDLIYLCDHGQIPRVYRHMFAQLPQNN